LKEIKQAEIFADFMLVRNGRLSVMECPEKFIQWLKVKGVL